MTDNVSNLTSSPHGTSATPQIVGDNGLGTALLQEERRQRNPTLRKLVSGLLDHVRDLSDRADQLSPQALEHEHQRFNWTAELMWAAMTDEMNKTEV